MISHRNLVALMLLGSTACGSSSRSDAEFKAEIVAGMHRLVLGQVEALNQAARDAQALAPLPPDRGWDPVADKIAIDGMRSAWGRMRAVWEGEEGVLPAAFPDLDRALDSRYEDLLAPLAPAGDADPFDGRGVVGLHALERILWASAVPAAVISEESMLAGYAPPAWPATADQARAIKMGLYGQLVADTQGVVDRWKLQTLELSQVFDGLTALMSAQAEKVRLAAERMEESRYAQRTLADMRDNLTGTRAVYALFAPWVETRPGGAAISEETLASFDRLEQTYASVPGDAIPPPPATFNSASLSVEDQQSAFGQLYLSVVQEVDGTRPGSAVDAMNHVALALGFHAFVPPN